MNVNCYIRERKRGRKYRLRSHTQNYIYKELTWVGSNLRHPEEAQTGD